MAEKIKFSFLNKNKVKKQTNDLNSMTISEKEIVEGKVKFTRYNNLSKGMLTRMYIQIGWIMDNCMLTLQTGGHLLEARIEIQECLNTWKENQIAINEKEKAIRINSNNSDNETNK